MAPEVTHFPTLPTGGAGGVSTATFLKQQVTDVKNCPRTFGDKVVAGMGVAVGAVSRSAEQLVSTIMDHVKSSIQITEEVATITESFVWVFTTRRSLKTVWFSIKELGRFRGAICEMASRIQSHANDNNDEQTFCKYWVNFHLSKAFGCICGPPERDAFILKPLFPGWLGRFISRSHANRDISFFYSLQKGAKMMWPQLGAIKEISALEKHKANLTASPRASCPMELRAKISELSNEIFDLQHERHEDYTKMTPQGSACLQCSRREGGQRVLAETYQFPFKSALNLPQTNMLYEHESFRSQKADFNDDCSVCINVRRHTFGCFPKSNVLGKLPALNVSIDDWKQDHFDTCVRYVRSSVDRPEGEGLRHKVIRPDGEEFEVQENELDEAEAYCKKHPGFVLRTDSNFGLLDYKVLTIPEPGKFRILTLGDGYLYTALQPVQGYLLGQWKRCRYSTMLETDLLSRIRQMDSRCPELYWYSVDYEAATDLLNRSATMAVLDTFIGSKFYPLLKYCFQRKGKALYPDGSFVRVTEAQLMGHPISFPLLCIINLAVIHRAIDTWLKRELEQQGMQFRYTPAHVKLIARAARMKRNILVNGDDAAFKGPVELLTIFRETAASVGLKISVGKNYVSRDTVMINSEVFRRREGVMERFGYLNLKLIKGFSLKTGESNALPTQIGRELNSMIEYCPWVLSAIPAAMKRFNSLDLKKGFGKSFLPNWYMPVHLGGYGLDVRYAPDSLEITRQQRRIAANFICDPKLSLMRFKGVPLALKELFNSTCKIRPFYGSGPLREYQPSSNLNAWMGKIAYASCMSGNEHKRDDRLILLQIRKMARNPPIKIENIPSFWRFRCETYAEPYCPPFRPIDLSLLSTISTGFELPVTVLDGLRLGTQETLSKLKTELAPLPNSDILYDLRTSYLYHLLE